MPASEEARSNRLRCCAPQYPQLYSLLSVLGNEKGTVTVMQWKTLTSAVSIQGMDQLLDLRLHVPGVPNNCMRFQA